MFLNKIFLIFSNLLFNWVQPILRLGKQRPLNFEDIPYLPYYCKIYI